MQIPMRNEVRIEIVEDGEVAIPLNITEEIDYYKELGQKILRSSLDIEEWIKEIISQLLFQNTSNPKFLRELFLDSSFCMFNAKIKILNQTLNFLKISNGKKRAHIQNILSKVNKYRNIFAHGNIYCKDYKYYITYFEGELKDKELNEEFFSNIEDVLLESFEILRELQFTSPKKMPIE